MTTAQYGLKYFIHRRLAVRLLIGGTLIATLLGMATYLTRYDDIGQTAIFHAINGIERLRLRVSEIVEESGDSIAAAIQQGLDENSGDRIISRYGQFVSARFYTHRTVISWRIAACPANLNQRNSMNLCSRHRRYFRPWMNHGTRRSI